MVAASCRRVERLFLDQGVAGRERLRRAACVCVCVHAHVCVCVCVCVRNTAVLKEVPSSHTNTHAHMHLCSSAPLKPGWCVYHVLAPLFSPPSTLFSRYNPPTPPPAVFPSLLFLPLFLSFLSWLSVQMSALSHLFAGAQSSVLHPSVYLCLHSVAPSALLSPHLFSLP